MKMTVLTFQEQAVCPDIVSLNVLATMNVLMDRCALKTENVHVSNRHRLTSNVIRTVND